MIVRAGAPVVVPILFNEGRPDGEITFDLFGPGGVTVDTGAFAPPADAVSTQIPIAGDLNTLPAGEVLSYRDLVWSYEVGGVLQNFEQRYTIEARLPFGVSADGVRAKLGVDKIDLPDNDISLAKAYLAFRGVVGAEPLAAMDSMAPAVTDAIEALAALYLIPTMAVRVAAKQSSGTDQFQRQKIDWDAIATALETTVSAGYIAVVPSYDETAGFGGLFIVVTAATDRLTGATG